VRALLLLAAFLIGLAAADSQVVAVGSQNWSGDGVLRNRDATLIIYNEDAAKYWQQIFIHDRTRMASQQAVN